MQNKWQSAGFSMRAFFGLGFPGLGLLCLLGTAMPAFAQLDSFRPGAPYSAVTARAPDQCVAACAGDAACGAWNFVRVRAGGPAVCEFLAHDVGVFPRSGTVSGVAASRVQASSRLVRQAPGLAVRVGQPAVVRPAVVRRGKVERRTRSVTEQARGRATRQAPRFRHALEGGPIRRDPRLRSEAVRPAPARKVPASVPVVGDPVGVSGSVRAPSVSPFAAKPVARMPVARMPVAEKALVPEAAAPVAVAPQTQESLFGSLYDDVAVPSSLPAARSETLDADAPIATATSRPVIDSTIARGLAGG